MDYETLIKQQSDLTLLVVRMARRLRAVPCQDIHSIGNKNLADQAMRYLARHNLIRHKDAA